MFFFFFFFWATLQQAEAGGEDEDDEPAVLRLLEPGDSIRSRTSASRVSGLDAVDGTFFMCDNNIYFLAGYALNARGKLSPLAVKGSAGTAQPDQILKWSYEDIKDVLRRRYCLQVRPNEQNEKNLKKKKKRKRKKRKKELQGKRHVTEFL